MRWVIIASGPSMKGFDLEPVRRSGRKVMVINNSWELAPWADVLYAGDAQWWDKYHAGVTFKGQRWTAQVEAAHKYGICLVQRHSEPGLDERPGHVNAGGNSGYAGINLAYHFGARDIILLGYDMKRTDVGHWHGDHENMLSAPDAHIKVWKRKFESLAQDLHRLGVRVINSTPGTALECFPRMTLEQALDC